MAQQTIPPAIVEGDPAEHIGRGERLLAAGHAEAALAAFRPAALAASAATRAAALDGMARAWVALEQPELALGFADQAVAAHGAPAFLAGRARVLLRLGSDGDAEKAAAAALALHPTEKLALAVKAEIEAARGAFPVPTAPERRELAKPVADALASALAAAANGALLVGVCWESARPRDLLLDDPPGTPGAARFSASLELCLRHFAQWGVRLVVLRQGPADAKTRRVTQAGIAVDPLGFMPDAAVDDGALCEIVERLDAVVAVDSRVAQLAGILGKPCFVLLPSGIIGSWPEGELPDPFKSLTPCRQPAPQDWETPFRAAAQGLWRLMRARPKQRPAKPVAPDLARKAQALMAQGNDRHTRGDVAAAVRAWRQALGFNPRLAAAWGNLGVTLRAEDLPEAALACYREALGAGSSEAASTIGNMGNAEKDCDRLEDAMKLHQKAVSLDPNKASNHHNLGITYRQAGRYHDAVKAFEDALKLKPDWTSAKWDLALVRLHVGDFDKGWPLYESRWQLPEMTMPKLAKPLWNGEPLEGQTILLHSEQGFGDAIQCVRYVAALKSAKGAGRVVLDCKPQLARLFAGAEGVDEIVPRGKPLPAYSVHCPLNSLPGRFQTTIETIPGRVPFLTSPEGGGAKSARAMARAGRRLRVGVVWSGSVTFTDNHHRATTLARFLKHFGLPGICLYSLQKGPTEAEIKALGADAPIVDLAPLIDDFADTAAAVEQLDLVAMTDSSVAHLCGALGRPVWVLLPFHAHWLWLGNDRDATPWYPTMRFFRQPNTNDWDTPFRRAAEELATLARGH
ncbi:MAG: tetratricopeptide repeat protein [Rhodospirillales bacterium]